MKRLFFIILVFATVSISTQAKYSGGSGTASYPYQIATEADLLALAANTDDYDKCFVLTADIDLSEYSFTAAVIAPNINNSGWSYNGVSFTGSFNGNDRIINNLTINAGGIESDFLGLFGSLSGGEVKYLQLKNIRIIAGAQSNSIGGIAGDNNGLINGCLSTGTITGDSNTGLIGGLAGGNDYGGDIINSYSAVNVKGGFNSDYLGGLAGGSGGDINNSYSTGNVSGSTFSDSIGGLVGYHDGNTSNCFSTGKVLSGTTSFGLGGLIGQNCLKATINNCYSTGTVTSKNNSTHLGGLVGANSSNISNSYSTGKVTGGYDARLLGGLVGNNDNNGIISNCYFQAESGEDNGFGEPLTIAQMKQQNSYVGFDFIDIWRICENVSSPRLAWFYPGDCPVVITKCTVIDGARGDSIYVSGSMVVTDEDFANTDNVEVAFFASPSDVLLPVCFLNFSITGNTYNNGNFAGLVMELISFPDEGLKMETKAPTLTTNDSKCHFKYSVKTRKFYLTAKGVNLSGLCSPVSMSIRVGEHGNDGQIDETIINGPRRPIPISLLMGVSNTLRIDKSKFKHDKKRGNITCIAVSGGFSVANTNDANLAENGLDISLSSLNFTIPGADFKFSKGRFSCTKVLLPDGEIAAATFDFNKCTFALTIKNTKITKSGNAKLNVAFGKFSTGADVVLP
jgi:hypothetical protein